MKFQPFLVFVMSCLASVLSADEDKSLVFSNSNADVGGAIVRAIVPESASRFGYTVQFVHNPAERSLRLAEDGAVDGEGMRVRGLSSMYPNLIESNEPIFTTEFVTFQKVGKPQISSWDDLSGLDVGFIRGWKIVEQHEQSFGDAVPLTQPPQIFAMLAEGRLDVGIFTRTGGEFLLGLSEDAHIVASETPLAVQELVMYFHASHAELVPVFDASLREMKEDGTYDELLALATGK